MTDALVRNMLLNVLQNDNPGMSEEEINNLSRAENEDDDAECAVCMSTIDFGTEVVNLRCGHSFHPTCISRWLARNGTCPNCRSRATERTTSPPLQLRPSNTYNITFDINDVIIRTIWNSHDTMVDIIDFVSRIDGVDKIFEIRGDDVSFKNTEGHNVLTKSLVRCGLRNETTFKIINHPNIMVFDIV